MENKIVKNIIENGEMAVNEVLSFKGKCNRTFEVLGDDFATVQSIFGVLENSTEKNIDLSFDYHNVIKLIKDESLFLQETVEGLIYQIEEENNIEDTVEKETEDLKALRTEYANYLNIILNDTKELHGVAYVLAEAMERESDNIKERYISMVKMGVKKLNDMVEEMKEIVIC